MTEVIRVEDVVKTFTIRKQKSLKEAIVNSRQGRLHTETFTALDQVSVAISSGESVGLVGPNGSGKSTLLKLIGGILAPNEGRVATRGRIAALLELGAGFHNDLSGRENVFLNASVLGLTQAEAKRYFEEIVEFSEIGEFIDTQVKFYSSGMYVRLAFAIAVHVDPDILLVDEVLAVGDEPFQAKCMQRIRRFQREGRTIVFVSHAPAQVADLCDRAILLQHGRVIADNEPKVALAALHDFYQPAIDSARQESAALSPYAAGLGPVHVSDAAGRALTDGTPLAPGGGIRLDCVVDFPEAVPDWAFRVAVEDGMGNLYTAIDSREHLELRMRASTGTQRFTIAVPELWVGDGEYHVALSVRDADDLMIGEVSRAGSFAVRGLKLSDGPVFTTPRIELH